MKSLDLIKPYFIENRRIIFFGFICLIIVDMLQLFIPRIIKWAVDDLTVLAIDTFGLMIYALYIVGIGLAIGVFRYLWRRCLLGTSRRVEEGLRNKLFAHTQTLSAGYFDKTQTGDLMARATNDIQQVRMATGMGMVALNDAVVLGAAAVCFMAYIHIRLTLFVLIPMPFIVLGTRFFGGLMHRRYKEVQESFGELTEGVRERLAGIRIIKAYGMEKTERHKIEQLSHSYIKSNLQLVSITGTFFPMMLLFSNISLAIVIYLGGRQTILQEITPGDFVAFISYLGLLTWPMMALGWVTNLIQRGRASLDRINNVLQTQPDIRDAADPVTVTHTDGAIRFQDVWFAYDKDTPYALTQIDFELAPGHVLGIIGPPGSGKTSLLNLVPRFYDASKGRILIAGTDTRTLCLADLRARIAYVPQEPFMFAGTITENITLGDARYPKEDIENAAHMAAVHDTIESFPKGYATIVGEKGVILSGGQKQRIALARAFLRQRPILLLDDPISQVDTDTGHTLIQAIRDMASAQSIIIVSHRLSAVQFADTIMSMAEGRIIEYGTHEELILNNQYYARTLQLQEISPHAI